MNYLDKDEVVKYKIENLDSDSDDGTMVKSLNDLTENIVGHKIIDFSKVGNGGIITLDNGNRVRLWGESDCCAYTDLEYFLTNLDDIDHVITGIGTTDGFTKWHIYADFGDILEIGVSWSAGNAFYYGYGFSIQVY